MGLPVDACGRISAIVPRIAVVWHYRDPAHQRRWATAARDFWTCWEAGMKTALAVFVLAVGLSSCSSPSSEVAKTVGVGEPVSLATPGERAVERFLSTWNSREPEQWAGSLHFPHTRPSVAGNRLWLTRAEYVATVDYERVLATGWDHTEYEDVRSIHAGDRKAHIAGRWARFDVGGNVIQRNLVTYVAIERNGEWGIRARSSFAP